MKGWQLQLDEWLATGYEVVERCASITVFWNVMPCSLVVHTTATILRNAATAPI
jgi:hypothetical protein